MSNSWNRSHWNRDKISVEKPLTIPQTGTVLFTNDEKRIPLCVIWKQDGSDIWHVRGITDEFNHAFNVTSSSRAIEYVEDLLKRIQEEMQNEQNS